MADISENLLMRYAQNALFGLSADEGGAVGARIAVLDSEKKRTFRFSFGSRQYIIKVNPPACAEENSLMKMLNERAALELLGRWDFKWAPRLCHFGKIKDLSGAQVLITDYIRDTDVIFKAADIDGLVSVFSRLHAIRSSRYTMPFGDVNNKIRGSGYDFVLSYAGTLVEDARRLMSSLIVKKLGCVDFIWEAIAGINRRLEALKGSFKETKEFSFLHCHTVRDEQRRHVLITKGREIFLIDWESACFGERELEAAAFIYENNRLEPRLKKRFLASMANRSKLSLRKVEVYVCLLVFDDLIEDLKGFSGASGTSAGRSSDKAFLYRYRRQAGMLGRYLCGDSFCAQGG